MSKEAKPKKETVFLGDEIQEYLNALKVSNNESSGKTPVAKAVQNSMNLLTGWQLTAPPHLLKHTDNVVYSTRSEGTEILVYVDSGAYAAELTMDKELYRRKLEQVIEKEIDDIKFLVSRKTMLRKKRF